jgi:hypothetical protein
MTDTAVECASRGKAYLDGYLGEDWPQYVDAGALDMSSTRWCLLAQLAGKHPALEQCEYGTYWDAMSFLGKDDAWGVSHGFSPDGDCTEPNDSPRCTCAPQYAQLQAAWLALLGK